MEEHWLWYISGMMDTAGVISGKVTKDDSFGIGYDFKPQVALSRPEKKQEVFGMLDEYCEEQGVFYFISSTGSSGNDRFIIEGAEDVEKFLEPIVSGFVQQREEAGIMLEEVIPLVEEGQHREKEGFIEVIGHLDKLRETVYRAGSSKYNQDYFKDEWSGELSE